jgi:hypothetical protein
LTHNFNLSLSIDLFFTSLNFIFLNLNFNSTSNRSILEEFYRSNSDYFKLKNIDIILARVLFKSNILNLVILYNILLSSILFLLLNTFNKLII